MKKVLTILIILCSSFTYASEFVSPINLYKDNYFTAGNFDDQVKFQFSAKYNLFYTPNVQAPIGLYLGYTQTSWWTCYDGRDTFSSNYMPETFYQLESENNIFNNINLGIIDYIQLCPIQHASNGVEGVEHRGINIYYGQIQLSVGEVFNFGTNIKGFGYYTKSGKNKDINDYKKNYEAEVFFKLKSKNNWYVDKYELHAKCTGNPLNKGYYVVEGVFQIFTSVIQPKIFISYNKGYGINLLTYNQKETELRAGVIF